MNSIYPWGDTHKILPVYTPKPAHYHYHFDAGLVVTTPQFRADLSQCTHSSFTQFGETVLKDYAFRRSCEEPIAEAFLMQNKKTADLVGERAAFFQHLDYGRAVEELPPEDFDAPEYKRTASAGQGTIPLEGEYRHLKPAIKKLRWKPFAARAARKEHATGPRPRGAAASMCAETGLAVDARGPCPNKRRNRSRPDTP